jgi:hypothetical protein
VLSANDPAGLCKFGYFKRISALMLLVIGLTNMQHRQSPAPTKKMTVREYAITQGDENFFVILTI